MGKKTFRTSRVRLLIQSIVAPALVLIVGCGRGSAPKHAILLLLDAARPDRFSCYGYARPTTPNIDSLAARGWLFENHFTHDTDTRGALPPLFLSRYIAPPMFPVNPEIPLENPRDLFRGNDGESMSLPRILSLAGYRTVLISAHPWITEDTKLADEFHEIITPDGFPQAKGRMPRAQELVDRAIHCLVRSANTNCFLYLHLMDTHFPHAFGEDAEALAGPSRDGHRGFDENGRPRNLQEELSPVRRRYLDAIYDGSLKSTDRAIGRLVANLQANRRLEKTLVIVTADHGEHLLEHAGRFEHGGPWYDTLGKVPLVISYGGRTAPKRVTGMTEAVDLLPTILSLLEVSIPRGISPDGTDLATLIRRGRGKPYSLMYNGVRSSTHKLILANWRFALGDDGPVDVERLHGQLYDLAEDPDELNSIWSTHPQNVLELVRTYREAMRDRFDRFQNAVTEEQPRSAFAIAAKDLNVTPEPLPVSTLVNQRAYRLSMTEKKWVMSSHWRDFGLLASAEVPQSTVRISIPNGAYDVSAAMAGQCTVSMKGLNSAIFLEGLPITPGVEVKCPPKRIGEITVQNELFEVTLRPRAGEGWFLMKYLLFRPIGVETSGFDDEDIRRLRALGYLN